MDGAEPLGDILEEGGHRLGIGGVDPHQNDPVLVEAELLLKGAGLVGEKVGDDELVPPCDQPSRQRTAEPSGPARDHNRLRHARPLRRNPVNMSSSAAR